MKIDKTAEQNPETKSGKFLGEFFRRLMFLAVFAIFPIIVFQVFLRQVDSLEVEKKSFQENLRRERILTRLREGDDEAKMLSRAILRVYDLVSKEKNEKKIEWEIKKLRSIFPGMFDVFFFDSPGKVIPKISWGKHPKKAVEKAFCTLQEFSAKKEVLSPGLLKSVLNVSSLMPDFIRKRELVSIWNRDYDGFLVWDFPASSTIGKVHSFFALLHPGKFKKNHALYGGIKWVNRRSKDLKTGLIKFNESVPESFPENLKNTPELVSQLHTAFSRYEKHFKGPDYHATAMRRKGAEFLIAISTSPRFFTKTFFKVLNLVSLVWVVFILFKSRNTDSLMSIRIPFKLTFLFLFAIGIPSLVLMIGGYYALKDHENVLLQNLESKMKNKLKEFDERIPGEINDIEIRLQNIIREAAQFDNLAGQTLVFQKFSNESLLRFAFVVDKEGREVWAFRKYFGSPIHPEQEKLIRLIGRELLGRLNKNGRIDAGALMVEVTEGVFKSLIGGKDQLSIEKICRELGKCISLKLGTENSLLYIDALFGKNGRAKYAIEALSSVHRLERKFLEKNLSSLMKQPDLNWKVHAIGVSGFKAFINSPKDREQILKVADAVTSSKSSIRFIVASGTEEELWYGTPGNNLSLYSLIAQSSLTPLRKQVNLLWKVLLGITMMVLVSTLFIGFLLSDQFLSPINALTIGVKAIEDRKFNHRIPLRSKDEFGDLSYLLNHVLEGMKDLQVAKIVQENLFPSTKLESGEYSIWGKSIAMTDIGGDYFDYFFVPPNKLMGVVGDVSGHGVSAALIMGMAKFAFSTQENFQTNPIDLMKIFNSFMLSNIKRKKMMTLFLYTLNTDTHRLEYCNAGHNNPFWHSAKTGKITQIGEASFPLGLRSKGEYILETLTMEPGDSVLFYTDGLVEANNKAGEMLEYDRALAWFLELARLPPEECVEKLFEKFDHFTMGMPAEDDISLICLNRKSETDL